MRKLLDFLRVTCALVLAATLAFPQNSLRVDPAESTAFSWLSRPYQARRIGPVRLTNSPRLNSLIRAGNLYLSAQDVVALVIENNVDIEVQRYTPLLAQEVLRRAEGGGALRSVGLPVVAGPQSVSLQGVTVNAGGVATGAGVSSGGGIVTQLGPAIVSLDPNVSFFANFQHATTPQSNTVLTGTTALIQDTRSYQASYNQNFLFGLNTQLSYSSNYVKVNSLFSISIHLRRAISICRLPRTSSRGLGPR